MQKYRKKKASLPRFFRGTTKVRGAESDGAQMIIGTISFPHFYPKSAATESDIGIGVMLAG
jgi:hypothetical protein